jgi:hypothetical protein
MRAAPDGAGQIVLVCGGRWFRGVTVNRHVRGEYLPVRCLRLIVRVQRVVTGVVRTRVAVARPRTVELRDIGAAPAAIRAAGASGPKRKSADGQSS